jgi:hypothetical protein
MHECDELYKLWGGLASSRHDRIVPADSDYNKMTAAA